MMIFGVCFVLYLIKFSAGKKLLTNNRSIALAVFSLSNSCGSFNKLFQVMQICKTNKLLS